MGKKVKITFMGKISDGNIGRKYINVPREQNGIKIHEKVKPFQYKPLRITVIAEEII